MFCVDCHLHSKYSFDGQEELTAICDKAIERGISEIAITDHMDIFSDKKYEYILDTKSLYEELRQVKEAYAKILKVQIGVELGQPHVNPKEARRFLQENSLDFIIGSLHNIENDIDVATYNFDKLDCEKVYSQYVEGLITMVKDNDFDVVGHITYPLRYMANSGHRIDTKIFEEQISQLYKRIIERGKGIEINTSGLVGSLQETMPSLSLLKLYKECGGEIITIGSDAHYLKHVGLTSIHGMQLLKEAGFKYFTTFTERKTVFHKIEV